MLWGSWWHYPWQQPAVAQGLCALHVCRTATLSQPLLSKVTLHCHALQYTLWPGLTLGFQTQHDVHHAINLTKACTHNCGKGELILSQLCLCQTLGKTSQLANHLRDLLLSGTSCKANTSMQVTSTHAHNCFCYQCSALPGSSSTSTTLHCVALSVTPTG